MYPHAHFMAAVLTGAIGYQLGWIGFFDIFIAGFLAVIIDFDHYVMFFLRHRILNPKTFWNKMAEVGITHEEQDRSFIHHGTGMFIIFPLIGITALFNPRISFILLAAYGTHMILDHIGMLVRLSNVHREFSIFGFRYVWNYFEEFTFLTMTCVTALVLF